MTKGIQTIKKLRTVILLTGVAMAILPLAALGQKVHPKKKIFKDVASWPATAPGDVKLKNFGPFRAVYDRTYKQGSGLNASDQRRDRVIISAEEVGWDGRRRRSDHPHRLRHCGAQRPNARVLTMFLDLDNLSMLFEIGPIPGNAKDYYIGRIDKDEIFLSRITTDAQKLEPQKMKTDKPGFGPNAWVMASMNLRKGLKIMLSPTYSPRGNLTSATYGHIVSKVRSPTGQARSIKPGCWKPAETCRVRA